MALRLICLICVLSVGQSPHADPKAVTQHLCEWGDERESCYPSKCAKKGKNGDMAALTALCAEFNREMYSSSSLIECKKKSGCKHCFEKDKTRWSPLCKEAPGYSRAFASCNGECKD